MNLDNLTLMERLTVYAAYFIFWTLVFSITATFIYLLTDGMIDYLTLGQYNIRTF